MKIDGVFSGYAFSGNPIWICHDNAGGFASQVEKCLVKVEARGAVVYEGVCELPMRLNASELVAPFCAPVAERSADGSVLYRVEDGMTVEDRRFNFWVVNTQGDQSDHASCVVLPGRVSRQNFVKLHKSCTDIFAARFLADKGNFFLTTKTNSWLLQIPETEVAPLCFISSQAGNISFTDRFSGERLVFEWLEAGIYAVDVEELRVAFAERYGMLPSVLDVEKNGCFSCRIVITAPAHRKDCYRLKFRNAYGFFELLELSGPLTRRIGFDGEDEQTATRRYDSLADDFIQVKTRAQRGKTVFSASSGFLSPRRMDFFADMLGSEEVCLLGCGPVPLPVIPSIEEFEMEVRTDAPKSFTLNLTLAYDQLAYMADISGDFDSVRPRVFSRRFTKQFN